MKCFKLTLAIALVAIFLSAVTVEAQTTYYSHGVGNWNDSNTWYTGSCTSGKNGGTYPVSGDTANICASSTVTVSSANGTAVVAVVLIADSGSAILTMEDGGLLRVETSLTVSGSGVCRFNTANTRPNLQAASPSVDLSGTIAFPGTAGGQLTSENSTDYFDVPSGTCTFSGSYGVENDARLYVSGGTLNIENEIEAASGGWFKVSSGTMDFNHITARTITSGADFYVAGGTMRFREDITTDGGFKQTGGTVTVDAGEAFTATGAFVAP